MRVLILGGTGLTGPFVAERLNGLGHEVTVFHRGEHEVQMPDGVRHVHGDLAHPPDALRQLRPDVVVHMRAMTEADAQAFLAMFRGNAGRAVVISSGDVYAAYGRLLHLESGPPGSLPITEDSPLRESRYPYCRPGSLPGEWRNWYDKILVEQTLEAQSELPVTILRFPGVYGPNDRHRFKPWLEQMTNDPEVLRIQEDFGCWRWTLGFSQDVAESVVLAVINGRAAGRIYNVGEPETPTMSERLEEWGRIAGWNGRIVGLPAEEFPVSQRMPYDYSHHLVVDTSRIRAELGYGEVVPHDEGIARTIAWERATAGGQG
jgi:nucleoside-diphosphate-sugar epimerase